MLDQSRSAPDGVHALLILRPEIGGSHSHATLVACLEKQPKLATNNEVVAFGSPQIAAVRGVIAVGIRTGPTRPGDE